MSDLTLVCVGLSGQEAAPESIQKLIETRLFNDVIPLPDFPAAPDLYWCDVLAALPESLGQALVVAVNAEVTTDILRLDALSGAGVAATLPLSLQHDIARPLMRQNESLSMSTLDLNHWLNRYAVGRPVELPMLAGFCGWVDLSAFRAARATNDVDLAESLRRQGYSILLSDEAFVDDSLCGVAANVRKDLPAPVAAAVLERHPYTALRHPLSELNKQEQKPPEFLTRGPGAILHISHSWGGGLGRWISDFCVADAEHLHLVLKSVGTREAGAQAFSLHLGAAPVPLKHWTLTTPIQSTSLGSYEYRQILDEIQASFSVQGVIVSTLIGHSLDVYDMPVPVIQVLHDYYPWCPPLYATWDNPCTSCDGNRLGQCLQQNPAHQFFGAEKLDWYLALRERFMQKIVSNHIPVVAPSQSVKIRWQQLAPPLEEYPVQVIGHGLPARELEAFKEANWESVDGDTLHLLVLGMLSDHKGGKTLKRLMPELLKHYKVTLLGTGEDAPCFEQHPNLTVVKLYQLPELPQKLAALKPDVGLLLSTVPETFSYTLSELFVAGIPPIASRLGAFADRIDEGVTGWLVSPSGDDLLKKLSQLDGQRAEINQAREQLLRLQHPSAADVAKEYLALMPEPSPLGMTRPLCRSVVADSGVSLDQGDPTQKALFVRPGAGYRLALTQFLEYSYHKVQSSPQLSRVSRLCLSIPLRAAIRLTRPRA